MPREFHLGVVSSIIQLATLSFAVQNLSNSNEFDEMTPRFKVVIAATSLASTIVQTVVETADRSMAHPLSAFLRSQWSVESGTLKKIIGIAKKVSAVAGIAAGAYDVLFFLDTFISQRRAYFGNIVRCKWHN